ncbi:MAG: leucine-rich repeat domain-containing protein [Saprospiraceae bacterium]|nr:leucine-rich repeat domain-containing protein [Saprospiraceae bacterium]
MESSNPKERIRRLIAEGETEQALALFSESLPAGSPLQKELLLLTAENSRLKKQMAAGIISPTEAQVNNHRITKVLIDLLSNWQNDAAELIELAKKSQSLFLDLGNCSLSAIPAAIAELQFLEELNLGSVYWDDDRNQFTGTRNDGAANDLATEDFSILLQLPQLKKVSLRTCNLKNLKGLGRLTHLRTLSIGQNDIKDIAPLAELINLEVLSLFGNRIDKIEPLAALQNLQILSLNDNMVSDISPLSGLQHLRELHAAGNRIKDLRPLMSLYDLRVLNLDANQVEFVEPVAHLPKLKTLNLNANPVRDCPPEIIFSRDIELIRTFFRAKMRSGAEPPRPEGAELDIEVTLEEVPTLEVKLILVGNSSSGKSSLSRLLRGLSFDTKENTTHGIHVSEWIIESKEIAAWRSKELPEYRIKVNHWDFGGQEYYHGTHRIFLDSNAVYVLIWDMDTNINRIENTKLFVDGQPVELPLEHFHYRYWLDNIRFHAPGAVTGEKPPLVLLQNKIDKSEGKELWHDPALLKQYGVTLIAGISARFARSRESGKKRYRYAYEIFREDLIQILVKKAEANAAIANLPPEWEQVRDLIRGIGQASKSEKIRNPFRERTKEKPWLIMEDFAAACRELRPELSDMEIEKLADYLHQTGVVVWLPNIDKKRIYTDPAWLTEKMYRVLNESVRRQQGRFNSNAITGALDDAEEAEIMILLMEAWEIIFPENQSRETWIAPQYLPDEHPMENLFTIALSGLQENFYMFRAPLFHVRRMLRRLVLRFGRDPVVEAKEYWKYGILFVVKPDAETNSAKTERLRVFIKSLPDEYDSALGRLMVCIEPGKKLTDTWRALIFREVLLTFLETRIFFGTTGISSGIPLREIAKQREELHLSINGLDFASIQRIVSDAEAGFSAVVSEQQRRIPMQEFSALLRAVEITPPAPSLFISYSHTDTSFRQALEIHLGALRRLGKIISWSDGQLLPGQDWNEAILRNLRSADIVILLVSPEFLDSDYIWRVEIAEAMQRQAEGKCRVIPILLRPCDWKDMAFARLELLPKDPRNARPRPVSLWTDRDEAYTIAVQGIKKALKELAVI